MSHVTEPQKMSTTLCLTLSPILKYYRSTIQFSEDVIVLNGMLWRLYSPKTTVHERPKILEPMGTLDGKKWSKSSNSPNRIFLKIFDAYRLPGQQPHEV